MSIIKKININGQKYSILDENYVHTDNNYSNEDKQKLSNLELSNLEMPTKVSQLENDANYVDKAVSNLDNYELKNNVGSNMELTIDNSTYVMTLKLKNSANEVLSEKSIDLPLETMVINATYDTETKEIILELQSGSTTRFSVADLVSGLQTEITSENKLASDLVDDSESVNKFVSQEQKNKIDKVITNGTGTKYLTDNGTYQEIDLSSKQDALTAGENITIENNVISAIGGGSKKFILNIDDWGSVADNELNRAILLEVGNLITENKPFQLFIKFYNDMYLQLTNYQIDSSVLHYVFSTILDISSQGLLSETVINSVIKIDVYYNDLERKEISSIDSSRNDANFANKEFLPINNSIEYIPVNDFDPATKKYVDDRIPIYYLKLENTSTSSTAIATEDREKFDEYIKLLQEKQMMLLLEFPVDISNSYYHNRMLIFSSQINKHDGDDGTVVLFCNHFGPVNVYLNEIYKITAMITDDFTVTQTYISVFEQTTLTQTDRTQISEEITNKPTTYAGYDATKTQVLKNINGVLTWVDEA